MSEEITNGELHRSILDIRQSDEKYREAEKIKLEKIDASLVRIELQTTKTNGKVIGLREDVDKHQTLLDLITGDRKYFLGALAALVFLQGALFLLARYYVEDVAESVIENADIDKKIQSGIIQALDNYEIK